MNRWYVLLFLVSTTLAHAAQQTPMPQELFAPYWSSEPGWDTELQLKNNLELKPLTVTPVLRPLQGERFSLAR